MAGASATATAAACAKRFEAPMTKVSKRYFGFSRAVGSPGPVAGAGCAASGLGAPLGAGSMLPGPPVRPLCPPGWCSERSRRGWS